jgi:hypothetical protein
MTLLGIIASSVLKENYADVILADNPIGFWLFDETTGTSADDLTANNNNMTIRNSPTLGVSTGLGGIPKCFDFDGTNDVCDTAYVSTFGIGPASNLSYEMWVRTTDAGVGVSPGVWKKGEGDLETAAFYINIAAAGRVGVRFMDSTNANLVLIQTSSGTFNDGNWHHLVATSASGGAYKLYVDAVEVASSSVSRSTNSDNRQITAGANGTADTSFANYINGDITAVAAYNTTLSSTTITAHYNAGL